MRKSWLVLLVGLTVTVLSANVTARQEVLKELIERALENNPELSSAAHMRASASDNARAAGALPDPQLTMGIMNLPINSFSLDQTPMSAVTVGLAQRIPWPGKLRARSDLADTRYRESGAAVTAVENRIVREVTDAYLEYSYWALTQPIIKDYLDLLTATRDIAEVRYANGNASAQDVLRISSMLSRTEVRLLKTEQQRHASLLDLQRAVGVSDLSGELPADLLEPDGSDISPGSVEANPILSGAALEAERAAVQHRLAQRDYWPDLTVGVDYSIREEVFGDPVRGADYLTFKVGINLPLWFFAKQKHDVRAARNMTLAAGERERAVREALTSRLGDAQSQLTVTIESLRRYDESILPEAVAAVEAARIAYEVGEVDFNALLAAQSDAFEIHLERLDLLRQYHRAKAAIDELRGVSYER